jgi:hypothetical protein
MAISVPGTLGSPYSWASGVEEHCKAHGSRFSLLHHHTSASPGASDVSILYILIALAPRGYHFMLVACTVIW